MKAVILVVEDDQDLACFLDEALTLEGYQVIQARDGLESVRLAEQQDVDLILLDLLMPGLSGWEVCRRIRASSSVPIIMVTALGREQEIVHGLDMGADDYIVKPFRVAELKARIRAGLRRGNRQPCAGPLFQIDDWLTIDHAHCCVLTANQPVKLSSIEYKLLSCFLENPGRILTHQSLLAQVWGWEYTEETDYLKVYVNRLRGKIEKDPGDPTYILTERGLGYRFQIPAPVESL